MGEFNFTVESVRAWLKRVALWTLASTQGKQMRKTLMKALPDEQAGTLWRRWGRAGLTFDGLLSLRPNQLGGRIVFDAAGRLITVRAPVHSASKHFIIISRPMFVCIHNTGLREGGNAD
eukprot:SAG31_NODE_1220_length_9296_cov_3.409046_8_plen_119_part_00